MNRPSLLSPPPQSTMMLQQQQLSASALTAPNKLFSLDTQNLQLSSQPQTAFDSFQTQRLPQSQSQQQQQLNELLLFSSASVANTPTSAIAPASILNSQDNRFPDSSTMAGSSHTPVTASDFLFMDTKSFDPSVAANQFQQANANSLALSNVLASERVSNASTANSLTAGMSQLAYPPVTSPYVASIQTSHLMFPSENHSPLVPQPGLPLLDSSGRILATHSANYDGSPHPFVNDFLSIPNMANSARRASNHCGSIMGLEALTAGLNVDPSPTSAHVQPSPNSAHILMVPSPFIRTIQSPMNSPFNSPLEPSFRSPIGSMMSYGKFTPAHRSSLLSPEQSANALIDFLKPATHPSQESNPSYMIPPSHSLPSAGEPKKTFEDFLAENGLLDSPATTTTDTLNTNNRNGYLAMAHTGNSAASLSNTFSLPDLQHIQQNQQQNRLQVSDLPPPLTTRPFHDDRKGVHDSVPEGKFWITLKTPLQTLYQCPHPDCLKTFTRPYNLKSHYRSHTGERPFKCEVCSQAFARKHDLKRHHKLHEGQKPFSCPACKKGFARSDALRRHLKPLEANKESACTLRLRLIAEIAKNRTMADIPRLSEEVEDKDVDLVERMIRGDLDEILTFAFTVDNEDTLLNTDNRIEELNGGNMDLKGSSMDLNAIKANMDLSAYQQHTMSVGYDQFSQMNGMPLSGMHQL